MYAHKHPGPTDPRVGPAIVYLIVGLPGAGKTTHAKELEISASALRLTPDEWQIALFGDQNPPDKRDLVEGKLVQLGMRAAELGTNVVFDFGFWGKDERSALRWIADTVGARSQVVYLPIDHAEQRRRITNVRLAVMPHEDQVAAPAVVGMQPPSITGVNVELRHHRARLSPALTRPGHITGLPVP